MKNILVVGGAGYLGGAVTDILLQKNSSNVRVYDNLLYEESYRKPVDFVYGDVVDTEKLTPHLEWADCVIWLAALVGDGACKLAEALTVEVNQESVRWLCEHYDGRIIFTSSCSVYGAHYDEALLDETSKVGPLSLYSVTKLKCESFLSGKNALIFRPGTAFGVSDSFARLRMDLVVNTMTVRAFEMNKITVFGGDQYRPLIHIKDIGMAICNAIDADVRGIYNLSSVNMKMIDLAKKIKDHFPDIKIVRTEMPVEDERNYRVSYEKAQRDLNFNPQFSLDYGIEELSEILRSNRIKNFSNARYSNALFLKEILK